MKSKNDCLSMKYASSDANNIVKDHFCFNNGTTEEHGCIANITTYSVKCTLNASKVGPALSNITNVHIRSLYICIDNRFTGKFSPKAENHVDITQLERFHDLLKFVITTNNRVSSYWFHLDYNNSTFQHMDHLEHFQFNVPIFEHLYGVSDNMSSLQILDLSFTLRMGLEYTLSWISNLTSTQLKEIRLQKVQIIGYINYVTSVNLTALFKNITFKNVKILDIRNNDLSTLYPGIVTVFPNIEIIDASYNQLQGGSSFPLFYELMMSPTLQNWDIANQQCLEEIPKYVPSFQDSDISRNTRDLRSTEDADFSFFRLPVSCINDASTGNVSKLLNSSVLTCRLSKCFILDFMEYLPCSVFPPLSEMINLNNDCLLYINLPFFQKIRVFNMSNTNWFEYNNGYSFADNNLCFGKNSLKEINVGYNSKTSYALQIAQLLQNMTFIGLNHVEILNLSGNAINIDISRSCTKKQSFSNSLRQMDLSHNQLNVTANFQPCNSCARYLTHIDLSNNGLSEIPIGIFSACSSLVSASLKRNRLNFNETFLYLTDATSLTELDLSENLIETLNPEFRKHLENVAFYQNQSRKITINMESNPILCSCQKDVVDFIQWMQTTSVQFKNKDSYTCTGIDGIQQITRINFSQYKSKCFPASNLVTIISTIVSTFGFMVMVCLIFLGYYKRFTVKYYIFRMQRLCQNCKQSAHTPHSKYKFDVFVSYCAEDRFWVHDVLMKELENVYKFKLCIHYRDFPAGGSISDVIVTKLEQSREIIFVLSDHFISTLTQPDRPWFQFELDEACDLVRLRRKNIIVIKLGTISKPVIDRNLAYLLEGGNIFLEWPENPKGHKVFWAKLVCDLYGDTQGCLSCCFNTRRTIGHRDVNDFSRQDSSDEDNDDAVIMGDNGRYFLSKVESCCRCCRKQSTTGYIDEDSVIVV